MTESSRDIMDLAGKSFGEDAISTITPELWNEIGLPIDFHPSFGWNVPGTVRTSAVGLGLAIQCAAVKARDIAKSGMSLWRRQNRQWTEVEPQEHWLAKVLARRPNTIHSWGEFWRMTVMHLEIAQNAYILKGMDRQGNITELLPLQPGRVRMRVSDRGNLFYEVWAANEFERAQIGETSIIVPASRVIHLRGKMLDGLSGLSNATLGNPIFELLSAISEYQTKLFSNDGKQPLVFETDRDFGTEERAEAAFRRLKEQLREASRRARATGEAILLEAGLKAKTIALNAKDAMTTEAYNQQVERICGLMETPPHKIFHYNNVKYDNQAAADNQYASDCLVPIADNIEEKFRNELLTEEEWDTLWPEFDRERMTAGDAKAINERVKIGLMTGSLMINEAREMLQKNPVKGGNVFFVPVNMAIMDEDGAIVQQAATGQTSGNEETENDPQGGDDAGLKGLRLVANRD